MTATVVASSGRPSGTAGVGLSRDGQHVAVLTLDAPPANALSRPVRAALRHALDEVDRDTRFRAAVLTGVGHFSAGGHLVEEQHARDDGDAAAFLTEIVELTDRVEGLRVPVVAAVAGGAVGAGLELALACDLRVAAEDGFFVAAGVNVGLIMSTWRLPRLLGLGPAKEMLLTGDRCDAATALRTGLVGAVVPTDAVVDAALERAHRIAGRSPLSVEATKAAANRAHELDAAGGRAVQAARFADLVRTRDHVEAVRSILDRTRPVYGRH